VLNLFRGLFLGSLLGALVVALFMREKPRKSRTVEQIAPKAMQYPLDFIDSEDRYHWLYDFVEEALQDNLTEAEAIRVRKLVNEHIGDLYMMQSREFRKKLQKLHDKYGYNGEDDDD
jgi:hypothetical protein